MKSPGGDLAHAELLAELEAIDGVRRALVDGPPTHVYLLCDHSDSAPTQFLARAILLRHGYTATTAELEICYFPSQEPPRRVRFVSARIEHPSIGRARAIVELEWGGSRFEREVDGQSGTGMELRLAAEAALQALHAVIGGALRFRIVGVKTVHAFDAELAVVILRADEESLPLLGASIVTDGAARAITFAVLGATNRILGNFLATEE